jgi:uncharacterized phage infection (PIP) family protein YhgE
MADPGETKSLNLIDRENIEDLLKTKESIEKELKAKEDKKSELDKVSEETSSELSAMTEEKNNIEISFKMTEAAVTVSEARQDKLKESRDEEEEKMDKLEKAADAIGEDESLTKEEVEELMKLNKEAREAQKTIIADINDKLDDEQKKQDELQAETDSLKNKLESLTDTVKTLEDQLNDVNSAIEETESQIIKAKSEIKSIEFSPEIVKYETEKETRANHARDTFPNAERQATLLNGTNDDDALKMFDADTKIMVEDIRELLGKPSESLVNKMVSDSGAMRADAAMLLAQKSLFDIKIAGIEERIINAATLGLTDVMLDKNDVPATHILALTELGYKVTHTDSKVIIDWGWASQS